MIKRFIWIKFHPNLQYTEIIYLLFHYIYIYYTIHQRRIQFSSK